MPSSFPSTSSALIVGASCAEPARRGSAVPAVVVNTTEQSDSGPRPTYEPTRGIAVAQRPNSETGQLLRPPCRKPEVGPPPRSAVGFLLLDSSLRPVAFNAEAIRVLSYPNHLA